MAETARLADWDDTRAWNTKRITGIEVTVEMPKIGVTLRLADRCDDPVPWPG